MIWNWQQKGEHLLDEIDFLTSVYFLTGRNLRLEG